MPDAQQLTVWHEICPSRALALLLIAASALACASLLLIDFPLMITAPAAAALCGLGILNLSRHALTKSADAIRAVRLVGTQKIEARTPAGTTREYAVLAGALLGPLIVLRLRATDRTRRRRSLVLLPDAMAPDSLRRLRVWLRWQLKQ